MTLATAIGYQAMGPIAAMDYANGVVLANTFDLDGRLTGIDSHIGGFGIVVRDYAFDLSGNITGVTDNAGTMSWDYSYDALYRLTFGGHDVLGGIADEESYSYDAAGNRTERIVTQNRLAVTDTLSYGAFSNRLETVSVFTPRAGPNPPSTVVRTLGYSGSGATATDDRDDSSRAWVLDYDSTDRLVSVSDGFSTLGAYVHNAQGQRVAKTVAGVTTQFLYDLGGKIIAEADGATGAAQAEYVWLNGTPLAFITGGAVYHVHPDHLGSPAKLTDDTGAVVWTGNARPFGEPDTGTGGSITFNLRFPGQYFDNETGLHYNMFRDYDASIGRYIESDPIGLRGGWNTYAYVGGNPVMLVDPFGENAQDVENMISWAQSNEAPLGAGPLRLPIGGMFGGWSFWETAARRGLYDPIVDWTYYSSFYYPKDRELDCDELVRLYQTVVHEAIHRTLCKNMGYLACVAGVFSPGGHDPWVTSEGVRRAAAQAQDIRDTYCPDKECSTP